MFKAISDARAKQAAVLASKVDAQLGFSGNKIANDSADKGSGKSPDEDQNHVKLNPMNDSDPQLPKHDAESEGAKSPKEENSFLLFQGGFVSPAIHGETISNAVFCSKRLVNVQATQRIGFML
jgi:hypothetical protein